MSKRKPSEPHASRSRMNFFSSRSSSATTPSATLIAFYEGSGGDHRGRALDDILKWGVGKLESSHDYIQTLFPLPEESGVNWDAPTIDREVFNAFRSRPELRQKLTMSFERMLWFYGFTLKEEEGSIKVVKGANYAQNSENWDTRFDHNHLRITRIIRCLRVLGLEGEALAFREALEDATKHVSPRSREFWRRAAERDLNLRPDLDVNDEGDNGIGLHFLREYEVKRKENLKANEPAPTSVGASTEEASEVDSRSKIIDTGAKSEDFAKSNTVRIDADAEMDTEKAQTATPGPA